MFGNRFAKRVAVPDVCAFPVYYWVSLSMEAAMNLSPSALLVLRFRANNWPMKHARPTPTGSW